MAYNSLSRWSGTLGVCAIVAIIRPAHADPRAVVELFTSQGCSSCPPADKIIGELAKDPNVIALSMPIDYWDYLGWKDTLADSRFSARQKAYSAARGDRNVYTPQVVVNGSLQVIGSDRTKIESAIGETGKADGVMSVPVSISLAGKQVTVSVAASKGPAASPGAASLGEVWICSVTKEVPISIGKGENRGAEGHLLQCGAQPAEGRRLERRRRQLDRAAGKYFAGRHRFRRGLCPGRQPRKARRDVGRGVQIAALNSKTEISIVIPGARSASLDVHAHRESILPIVVRLRSWIPGSLACARARNDGTPKRKRTNFRWPSMGINYPANRPDPDGPGGLGAEESGTERTGPTQDLFVATRKGGRLAEVGRYYDSSNVPVTSISGDQAIRSRVNSIAGASCSRARLARSCRGDDRRRP